MLKGISPVVSIVLLVVVAVTVVFTAVNTFMSVDKTFQESASGEIGKEVGHATERFDIEHTNENVVYVRNNGNDNLTDLTFYANDTPVDVIGSSCSGVIEPGSVCAFTLDVSDGEYELEILTASQTKKVTLLAVGTTTTSTTTTTTSSTLPANYLQVDACWTNMSQVEYGEPITLLMNITPGDNETDTAIFEVNYTTNYTHSNNGSITYWYELDTTGMMGDYDLKCYANDTANVFASLDDNYFTVYNGTVCECSNGTCCSSGCIYDPPTTSCGTCKWCDGAGNCVNQPAGMSCGVCKECNGAGSCVNEPFGTNCGTKDCDYLNSYNIIGQTGATTTDYCIYTDYADKARTCNGAGSCSNPTCDSSSNSTLATCGTCEFVGSCSGGGQSCSDYAAGTDSGDCRECDGSGGEQMPADDADCGIIDCDFLDYYFIDGVQGPDTTSYCKKDDYDDITTDRCAALGVCKDSNYCNYTLKTLETCGICQNVSSCQSGSIGCRSLGGDTRCNGGTGYCCSDGMGGHSCIDYFVTFAGTNSSWDCNAMCAFYGYSCAGVDTGACLAAPLNRIPLACFNGAGCTNAGSCCDYYAPSGSCSDWVNECKNVSVTKCNGIYDYATVQPFYCYCS